VSRAQADAQRARRLIQLAWLAVGAYLLGLGIAAVLRTQGDFNVYYRAGTRVLHRESLYRLDESSHFLYAPIFAIAFAPFATLPLRAAQFAWYLISAVSIVAMIRGSARMLFGREFRLTPALIVVPVLLTVHLIDNNIEHGQINLPTLALTIWSIIFAEEDRAFASGAMLAVAVLIKPFAALAGLFLLLERKWLPILYSVACGIILLIAPVAVFGPRAAFDSTVNYLTVVRSMTDRYTLMLTNQSAASAMARLLSLGKGAETSTAHAGLLIGTAIELILLSAVVVWFLRDADEQPRGGILPHRFQLAALFCIMPSLVPISWKSYYAALLVPYMLLIYVLWTNRPPESPKPGATLAMLAASAILNWIPGNRPNRIALFFSAHFLSSVVVLTTTAMAASWRRASAD
jgi:hypothetical protein